MSNFANPKYLREMQYKTPDNLNARVSLHQRFSTNPYPWQRWVFDQFPIMSATRIVDIGCGPAYLWAENLDRIPNDNSIQLIDFSMAMLVAAKESLLNRKFSFALGNVLQLPTESNQFDIAVANHMLYHVPDIGSALGEVRRILKSGGKFFSSTNGLRNLIEIWEWVAQALPSRDDILSSREIILSFNLENGEDLLAKHFSKVKLVRYIDTLEINESQPVVDFVSSSNMQASLNESELSRYKDFLDDKLSAGNILRVTKEMGVFVAE